jgi:hypothetical protein
MAMDWDDTSRDLLEDFPEDPFTCPESFFDASLDTVDMFDKDLFFSRPASSSNNTAIFPQHHMGAVESLDLERFLQTATGGGGESILSDTPEEDTAGSSSVADISAIDFHTSLDMSLSGLCSELDRRGEVHSVVNSSEPPPAVIKAEPETEQKNSINLSLQAVEFDIAKLKQEVDFSYDDDNSMWSDFFSEDDPSEISREYDDLLQSLLSIPANDIDLSLNVFNNVDAHELEAAQAAGCDQSGAAAVVKRDAEEEQQSILNSIQADHCYTLAHPDPSYFLTPPPSSDESDRDEEFSRESMSSPDVKPTHIKASRLSSRGF